ncbi:heparinase II/III family protein [Flagellimonas pacifica]|uniref:heparinase II/III family protein n=1 Tax=Flagellimonas pacifica TaxID=1247520 RepID=UPI0013FD558F|nr:heparinase II/III family protein [Allomuricauda parva]
MTKTPSIVWRGGIDNPPSHLQNNSFEFLNLTKNFEETIDWNFSDYGKLWTYNLNYFDFLNQKRIDKKFALGLIEDYITKDSFLKEGHEPYTISLRGINWIKFLAKSEIADTNVNRKLYQHYLRLKDNLEYHLLGNHLLENGYSMLFGAYYFKNEEFYKIASGILKEEMEEQILEDGAHFELSPMYHQIMLYRLLDCINLLKDNSWKKDVLYSFLIKKAKKMLGWLATITYSNGDIPMVNDCAHDIAPTSRALFNYAEYLDISFNKTPLKESGYRKFIGKDYELFVDVGNIGPDYQPGHAHSDTFSFELYLKEQPYIVEVGTSTYEKNENRQKERQTSSHNTVMLNNMEQTQVWGGFRVGKRSKACVMEDKKEHVLACHDGYKSIGARHLRKFVSSDEKITIQDQVLMKRNHKLNQTAFFHFHPSIEELIIFENKVILPQGKIMLEFSKSILGIKEVKYEYALGFNKTTKAKRIEVDFQEDLTTHIHIVDKN